MAIELYGKMAKGICVEMAKGICVEMTKRICVEIVMGICVEMVGLGIGCNFMIDNQLQPTDRL